MYIYTNIFVCFRHSEAMSGKLVRFLSRCLQAAVKQNLALARQGLSLHRIPNNYIYQGRKNITFTWTCGSLLPSDPFVNKKICNGWRDPKYLSIISHHHSTLLMLFALHLHSIEQTKTLILYNTFYFQEKRRSIWFFFDIIIRKIVSRHHRNIMRLDA